MTYTDYITMTAPWEKDDIPIKDLGSRLTFDSNTLTPLLKKPEPFSYTGRIRSDDDERSVCIRLMEDGRVLKAKVALIPKQMTCTADLTPEKLGPLLKSLRAFISDLTTES